MQHFHIYFLPFLYSQAHPNYKQQDYHGNVLKLPKPEIVYHTFRRFQLLRSLELLSAKIQDFDQ